MLQDLSRRERKKQETRDRILSVAHEMLIAKGFEGTTLEQVAEEADVSKATFYNYFQNKDALLRAIAEIEIAAVGEQMAGEPGLPKSPLAMIHRSLEVMFSQESIAISVVRQVILNAVGRGEEMPAPITELSNMLVDLVRQAQEQGELRIDLNPERLAEAIGTAYFTASIFCEGIDPSLTEADRNLTKAATALLRSVGIVE